MKSSQKEAVFQAITNVLAQAGVRIEAGVAVASLMTREHRAQVNAILFQGFKAGTIELETEFANDSELKSYVSGLQSNWLRKDKRLNGNTKYTPAKPGIRAGQGDAQLKAMRALLATKTDPKDIALIKSHIERRVHELNASKMKVEIDVSALPPELRKYA